MNRTIVHGIAFAVLLGHAALAAAEIIKVPLGAQGSAAVAAHVPERGISMDAVLAGWGEPEARQPAAGQPPITRWDYPEFFVYFEYQHVLHTVLRHTPVAPATP
jgi:hypothetical protein